jgi:glyoxylase-like metal-dependent hydrolase (beta-lactamase superfamily II)
MSNRHLSLRYAYKTTPEDGHVREILPGLKWVRLPLPFLLGHINVWLARDGDSWVIIDTGLYSKKSRKAWQSIFANELDSLPVSQVIVTHLHPDHVGCAGWLCDYLDVGLSMTMNEYLLCRILVADTGLPAPGVGLDFYHAAGFNEQQLQLYGATFGTFGKMVHPLPLSYSRLRDDSVVRMNGTDWRVIIGRGHSPEHACLFSPELNVLISGDQVLPTISPNVSVYPTEPAANPLKEWFDSLRRMKSLLPEDVLVLPAHGRPFRGVMERLDVLIQEHEDGLERLYDTCREPHRAVDVFEALFKGRVGDGNRIMATGEAVAHLNYLLQKGDMSVEKDRDGVNWYRSL